MTAIKTKGLPGPLENFRNSLVAEFEYRLTGWELPLILLGYSSILGLIIYRTDYFTESILGIHIYDSFSFDILYSQFQLSFMVSSFFIIYYSVKLFSLPKGITALESITTVGRKHIFLARLVFMIFFVTLTWLISLLFLTLTVYKFGPIYRDWVPVVLYIAVFYFLSLLFYVGISVFISNIVRNQLLSYTANISYLLLELFSSVLMLGVNLEGAERFFYSISGQKAIFNPHMELIGFYPFTLYSSLFVYIIHNFDILWNSLLLIILYILLLFSLNYVIVDKEGYS